MAKDPAVLWYWSDWRGGTGTLTRHLKGCYMDLLDAQFNAGPLSIDEIRTVLGADFGQTWPTLQKKFTLTESGLFYNERMELEKIKRKKFTDSRRANLESKPHKPHMDNHTGSHMDPHMENENANTNGYVRKGGMGGGRQPITQAMVEEWMTLKPDYPYSQEEDFHALLQIGKFIADQVKIRWLPDTDVGHNTLIEAWKNLILWQMSDEFYKGFSLSYIAKTRTLQTIWQKSKEVKNGTTVSKNHAGSGKSAGADELAARLNGKITARGASNPGG